MYRPTTNFVAISVASEGATVAVAPPLNNNNVFTFRIYFFILFTNFWCRCPVPKTDLVGALQAGGKVTDYATIIMSHRVRTVPSFKWFLHFLFNILFKLLNSLPSTPKIDQDHRA